MHPPVVCNTPGTRNLTLELKEAGALFARRQSLSAASLKRLANLRVEAEQADSLAREAAGREAISLAFVKTKKFLWQSKETIVQRLRDIENALPCIRKMKAKLRRLTKKRTALRLSTSSRSVRKKAQPRLLANTIQKVRDELKAMPIKRLQVRADVQQAAEALERAEAEHERAQQQLSIDDASKQDSANTAKLAHLSVEVAENQQKELSAELEAARHNKEEVAAEEQRGRAQADEPRLWRRATLPPARAAGASAMGARRVAQLAAGITVDWCIAARAAPGHSRCWEVGSFQETIEWRALGDLEAAGERGVFVVEVCGEKASTRHVLLDTFLVGLLRGPRLKSPPMRLNFFELIRCSMGDPMFQDVWLVPEAPHWHEAALGLDRMKDIDPPASLQAKLRPYQLVGFQWLVALARNGLGAILADDMGLGKTLQAIAMLVHLLEAGLLRDAEERPCPALVVVPPGLLRNWEREFDKWAPQLSVYLYHGHNRALPPNRGTDYNIFLTTYHMVRNDSQKFCDADCITFSCMVIDEAQCIKNHNIKMTKAIKEVGNAIGHTRIALSGTPIENKVDELHSIFDFANYGYLGDRASFAQNFSRLIEQQRDPELRDKALELLRRLTRPFQMRRLKTDPNILPDLPEKIDMLDTVGLTAEQQRLYTAIQEEFRSRMDVSRRDSTNHTFERRGHIFAMLERVRRICSHPMCLERKHLPPSCQSFSEDMSPAASGKTSRLFELLEEILPTGEKVIVFVTRKAVLSVLCKLATERFRQVRVLQFSGDLTLQARSDVEKTFSEDSSAQLLLITVQCGGIGLNLVAASHVIHFDRCYNPAKEAQATDRCHRLGQHRAVCVHRLVTEGTYEERLEEIMQRKQDLSSLTITRAEDWIADYDDAALFDLFMLRSSGNGRRDATTSRAAAPPPPAQTQRAKREAMLQTPPRAPQPVSITAAPDSVTPPPMSSRLRPRWAAHLAGNFRSASLPASSSSNFSRTEPRAMKRQRTALLSLPAASSSSAGAEEECEECSICLDAPAVVRLLPCGHRTLCDGCSERVDSCPICRARISARQSS